MDPDIANIISHLIIFMVVLLLAVSAHEAGHAWMSHKFGDNTAYMLGRVTLNPVKHTDPIGTLLIPIVVFTASYSSLGAVPLLGWGKPTPVNPRNWKNYKTANVMVSVAGVLANLALLVLAIALTKALMSFGLISFDPKLASNSGPIPLFLANMMFLNLSLLVFNLLPFPPLDGSKILATFLPKSFDPIFEFFEQYGFFFLIAFVFFGFFRWIIEPFKAFIEAVLKI